jgi:hypothetical protein
LTAGSPPALDLVKLVANWVDAAPPALSDAGVGRTRWQRPCSMRSDDARPLSTRLHLLHSL